MRITFIPRCAALTLPLTVAAISCLTLAACSQPDPRNGAGSSGATPAAAVTAAPIPQGLESFYTQDVDWEECEGDADYQCAMVKVPLDYDDPTGQAIDLSLKKSPATDTNKIGTLFVNPGGPGGSGVELVGQGADAFSDDLRAHFDIIGFDPRGVGESTPLVCLSEEEINDAVESRVAGEDEGGSGDASPSNDDEEEAAAESAQASIAFGEELAASCEANSPVPGIIDHMDTGSVARDLDVLRGLAGDPQLYYFGTSYGTYLGARYADMFPANVARMVLDSAQDPSLTHGQLEADQAVSLEQSLRHYVEFCQSGEECPLSGDVDAGMAQIQALIERANISPLKAGDNGETITGTEISNVVGQLLYDDSVWGALHAAFTLAINEGDGSVFKLLGEVLADPPEEDTDANPTKTAEAAVKNEANEPAMRAIDCLDYPVSGDQAEWDREAATTKEVAPVLGEGLSYGDAFCQGWGHNSDNQPAQLHAQGAAPILVIGITGDPATPYKWAEALASQLESGQLLTVNGNGHGAYLRKGECVDSAVDAYLLRGELIEEGLTCEAPTELVDVDAEDVQEETPGSGGR
ncbi:alpha/beta hydrolase [Actinomyces sp. MRS3W]|uniref:alpha/beta hydrolase n=1 Tax=Actinomyces sp. MRS3W TaxID=2800796 RepID=UPI0028FD9714|nr:alpha/beta hydrolase [Actinomyces sp. MRS3W]MDU0348584.1 alpha/beta hydrolase [Actinomyces sp. MRS3W]